VTRCRSTLVFGMKEAKLVDVRRKPYMKLSEKLTRPMNLLSVFYRSYLIDGTPFETVFYFSKNKVLRRDIAKGKSDLIYVLHKKYLNMSKTTNK
jgi:hypothetical protein